MVLGLLWCAAAPAGLWASETVGPVGLTCEYRENPLGIDVVKPRLGWKTGENSEQSEIGNRKLEIPRGIKQTAYQILVASTPDILAKDKGDLWDSGKVESDCQNQIDYGGKNLVSRAQCFWKVRVWTLTSDLLPPTSTPSHWSKPALWTMGLLKVEDWQANWIGNDAAYQATPEAAADEKQFNIKDLKWVQMPKEQGKNSVDTYMRRQFDMPQDRVLKRAIMVLYAFNECDATVNGVAVGRAAHWEKTARLDVSKALKPGANAIGLLVRHTDPHLPAAIGRLVMQFESGADMVIPLDSTWKVSQQTAAGWNTVGFDDAAWVVAEERGVPWGATAPKADLPRMPAPYLRKEFTVTGDVKRATVYVTAFGIYELRINGKRVGNDVLAPGWTEFRKRLHYQTYDVSGLIAKGNNAVGAILGDGWYSSTLAHLGRNLYGGRPRFLVQLELELADGSTQRVISDETWKTAFGPLRHADLLMGCEFDARLAMPGWDQTGFDEKGWSPVLVKGLGPEGTSEVVRDVTDKLNAAIKDGRLSLMVENDQLGGDPCLGRKKSLAVEYLEGGKKLTQTFAEHAKLEFTGPDLKITKAEYGDLSSSKTTFSLQASVAEPSRIMEELPARSVSEPRPGCWTFDLGQNMVGWVRLKVSGAAGQRITLRHAEMINADGTIYTAALRSCPAADFYTLSGKGEEVFEPFGTFHGFRYVEVRGLDKKPELSAVTGLVVHTPMRRTGNFECSNPMLNKLYSNIIWGQIGNYLEVPTDCPQRDERLGWTGDTQFFIPTGAYNFNVASFFTRWLQTCEDNQNIDGSFPNVIPDMIGGGGVTAWSDAPLICTYNIYRTYGDTRIIAERFDAMERYMKMLEGKTKDGISSVGGYGDWLNAGGGAKKEVMDTAYHAYLADIMSEMARAIGREDDAVRYSKLRDDVKSAFAKAFIQPDGSIMGSSQTGYALAFTMGMVPADMKEKMAAKFVDSIKGHNWHLATGFIGTPRLLPALNVAGQDDTAYRLLLTDTYPSWLFPVKNGATTMWERWDGWTPDRGFGDIGMNSFNHYAFGAVGEYLYGNVGGIQAASPGYKTITIRPVVGEGITWAKTSFDSPNGIIATAWKVEAGKLELDVTIPANTTATVHVPAKDVASITESGKFTDKADRVKFLRMENNAAVYAVGSGIYQFQSSLTETK